MMSPLNRSMRLWSTLEDLPGLAAPALEWRERLGTEFGQIGRLLRPTGELARSVDCPSPGGNGCPRRVVDHGNGEIIAVCGDVPRNCDDITLTRSDIVIYRIEEKLLCEETAKALDLSAPTEVDAGQRGIFHVGDFEPIAGMRFPVYLGIQIKPDSLESLAIRLWGASSMPFILITPTRRHVELDLAEKLAGWKARTAALADLLERNGHAFNATDAARGLLAEFRAVVMPKQEDPTVERFSTPPDARWGDVAIQFVDGHTVSIRCKSETGTFNYTQMGMVDRRNGNPDVQWKFLGDLAEGYGRMTWDASAARRENKKRKQTLNRRLTVFFGIDGEAITWDKEAGNYRCRFEVTPD
jgi:hypothetical protein